MEEYELSFASGCGAVLAHRNMHTSTPPAFQLTSDSQTSTLYPVPFNRCPAPNGHSEGLCLLTIQTVTWYSTSIVPFLTAVWKKHSNLPAGSRNVNSLSWLCPKQRTDPKHHPKITARASNLPPLPSFLRRRAMVKIFQNTGLSKFSHLLRILLPQQNFTVLWLDGGPVLRANQRRKSSNPPPITTELLTRNRNRYYSYCTTTCMVNSNQGQMSGHMSQKSNRLH